MSSKKAAEPTEAPAKTGAEEVYTAEEFVSAAKNVFGKSPDIVRAALAKAGVEVATVTEAKEIVDKFANKEVKK